MTDQRTKENLDFRRAGVVYSSPEAGHHVEKEYELVSDGENELGERVIVLKQRSTEQFDQDVDELVVMILEAIGETKSKVTEGILRDVFRDETHETIETLLKKVRKGEKVTTAPGCFKLFIGDRKRKGKRKSGRVEIMLRN